jgi:hypothetical protein
MVGATRGTPEGFRADQVKRPPIREDLKVMLISPRSLITLLLHQMVHHRTTLRGNGQ